MRRIEHNLVDKLFAHMSMLTTNGIYQRLSQPDWETYIAEQVTLAARSLVGDARGSRPSPLIAKGPQIRSHKDFDLLAKAVGFTRDTGATLTPRLSILLRGEAGCGKSALAEHLADHLGLPYWFNGPVQSEFKLMGYKDAAGYYHSTPFREAFEKGGVYLFDEIDASEPRALLSFNGALAQGHCDFPDRPIERHAAFVAIAAANTYGRGADRKYSGRNQLDAATLDRFVVIDVGYDDELELSMTSNRQWALDVQKWRSAAKQVEARHVISMRATSFGSKLLENGIERSFVQEMVVWRGLDQGKVKQIKSISGVE